MMFFGMLAGWLALSCATAPLIGNCLKSAGSVGGQLVPASVPQAGDHMGTRQRSNAG